MGGVSVGVGIVMVVKKVLVDKNQKKKRKKG